MAIIFEIDTKMITFTSIKPNDTLKMNYQDYLQLFNHILSDDNPQAPYDDADYLNYTKLNASRIKRWDKTLGLDSELVDLVKKINHKQHWIIIAEPWCGDAAHILPFLIRVIGLNDLISYDIQLRDKYPFLIDDYLTNGSKSIPKLIVRNEQGEDLMTWGPRPKGAEDVVLDLKSKNADFEQMKIELQNWYNDDKGNEIQKELLHLLKHIK